MTRIAIPALVLFLRLTDVILPNPTVHAGVSLAWEQVGGQPMGRVWWPVVDLSDANHLYVVADQGLYRSLTAGQSWTRIWAGPVSWEVQVF